VALDVSDAAVEALLDGGGFDPELGARPMRRAIGRLVEAPIAEMILRGELEQGDVALVGADGGGVSVDAVRPRGTRVSA
jgi:ATP-dependent Clp protease ATP-binding subunit ClpC